MRALAIVGAFCVLMTGHWAFAQVDYEALKHIDLRDLNANPTYLTGTAGVIMGHMRSNPARFVGPVNAQGIPDRNAFTSVVYYDSGARGPIGSQQVGEDGKSYWRLDPDQREREATRKNTIFSAEIEDIEELAINKTFKLKLVLFVHDPTNPAAVVSNGYYFRRLTVLVDWFQSSDPERFFQVLSLDQEIPLTATQFQVVGDILDRKVVLEDVVFGITKVFPLGVGSFNIRTGRYMDGTVKSMTREFPEGRLVRVNAPSAAGCSGSNNSRCRTYPWYYRGRPFFGIFTMDGGYHSIGMHWQIDANGLTRGFVSHGCIRVRDKDLYQLDAILNEGTLPELRVSYRYHQAGKYERLSHPLPQKNDSYWAAVYTVKPSADKIQCRHSTYDVQRDRSNPQIHTVADGDCLTMVAEVKRPATEVTEYMKGRTQMPPSGLYGSQVAHVPDAIEEGDEGAFECWESDGGHEERQRARNALEGFFQGLGNLFKRRPRRVACDDMIRVIPADPATPRQAPIAMDQFPAAPAIVVNGQATIMAPVPAATTSVTTSSGDAVFSPNGTTIPATAAVTPAAPARQDLSQDTRLAELKQFFVQNCEPRIASGLEIRCADTAIERLTSFRNSYCNPVRSGYETYCSQWDVQLREWTKYRNSRN